MQNAWLQAHLATIDRMTKLLTQLEYMPIFQDYPVKTLQSLYRGAVAEISRLQNEVDTLRNEYNKLQKQLEAFKTVPDENPEPEKTPKPAPKKAAKKGAPSA